MTAKVRVIIPCHNGEYFVEACLTSLIGQSEPAWEAVVVDDGSTDGTARRVEAWEARDSRVRLVRLATNQGVSAARNAGANDATGPYLLFLDADDLLHPEMLQRATAYLDSHPGISAVHVGHQYVDEMGQYLGEAMGKWPWVRLVPSRWGVRVLPREDRVTPFCSLYLVAVAIPSVVVMRREKYEAAGRWDEAFGQGCEDTDLFLRLALEGELHEIDEVLVSYRQHAAQHTKADGFTRQYQKLLAKWRELPLSGEARLRVEGAEWFRAHRFVPLEQLRAAVHLLRTGRVLRAARIAVEGLRTYSPKAPPPG